MTSCQIALPLDSAASRLEIEEGNVDKRLSNRSMSRSRVSYNLRHHISCYQDRGHRGESNCRHMAHDITSAVRPEGSTESRRGLGQADHELRLLAAPIQMTLRRLGHKTGHSRKVKRCSLAVFEFSASSHSRWLTTPISGLDNQRKTHSSGDLITDQK